MVLEFDNTFAELGDRFYSPRMPEVSSAPETLWVNEGLARELGVDPEWLHSEEGALFITGNEIPEGADPLAQVYAGHQFGSWVPQLGDGRALLIGEVHDHQGRRLDLQWKGSGRTPYSRRGDGRAPLGPILRELLVSEAMHSLGVPTTRVLATAATGDRVLRQTALPGAVLIRVASSHLRIGTMEYFASREDGDALKTLVEYTLYRHYPEREERHPLALLDEVGQAIAELVAVWQSLGFIHGVMNTDNMLLCGETIDYGPCAFMNEHDPATVFSSIDHRGRYAYGNQPAIAHWNLARLAQALIPAFDPGGDREEYLKGAQGVIDEFPDRYAEAFRDRLAARLGLSEVREGDEELTADLLAQMAESGVDHTLMFRALAERAGPAEGLLPHFEWPEAFGTWLNRWEERVAEDPREPAARQEAMAAVSPVFIPRNHRVEEALEGASEGSWDAFGELWDAVTDPFTYRQDRAHLATPPAPEQRVAATFCGT